MKGFNANRQSRQHFINSFQDLIMGFSSASRIYYVICIRVSLTVEEAGMESGWPMPMLELWSGGMYATVRFLYHEHHANNVAVALVYLFRIPYFKEIY